MHSAAHVSSLDAPARTKRYEPARAKRYEMLRSLASGGMGEVFLGLAHGIEGVDKLVVIKRLLPHFARDEEFVQMFLNEARLAATLDHANVVRVNELGRDEDGYFIVMEYLHGETSGRLLNAVKERGERLTPAQALGIAVPICAGLHYAHERHGLDGAPLGIVHRDVSPGNVMITFDGGVKLLDFGIAKATARTSITTGLSRKGKVPYMSPEQCVGEDVDRRSDIFSAGILVWELVTGQRLFRGENEFAIMNAVVQSEVPPPSRLVPELPPELDAVILKALEKKPSDRYQTALEFQLALEQVARENSLLRTASQLGRFVHDTLGARPYPSVDPRTAPQASASAALTTEVSPPGGQSRRAAMAVAGVALLGVALFAIRDSNDPPHRSAPTGPPNEAQVAPAAEEHSPPQPGRGVGPAEQDSAAATGEEQRRPQRRPRGKTRTKKPSSRAAAAPSAPKKGGESGKLRGLDGLLPRGK